MTLPQKLGSRHRGSSPRFFGRSCAFLRWQPTRRCLCCARCLQLASLASLLVSPGLSQEGCVLNPPLRPALSGVAHFGRALLCSGTPVEKPPVLVIRLYRRRLFEPMSCRRKPQYWVETADDLWSIASARLGAAAACASVSTERACAVVVTCASASVLSAFVELSAAASAVITLSTRLAVITLPYTFESLPAYLHAKLLTACASSCR